MKADDTFLVKQCLNGDGDAFAKLVDAYQKPVFNAALRMVSNFDDARDITQSVFLKAFQNLRNFNSTYRFYSWIYRIAINESINLLNKRNRFEELDADQQVSRQKSPEGLAHHSETSKIVHGALQELKPDHRSVVVLRHFRQFNYREISEILEIPEKTVKSRLFEARRILRGLLATRGVRQS